MEMIHVMIAFVIIMTMAVGTVALKLYMFPEEKVEGFQPLPQQVMVVINLGDEVPYQLFLAVHNSSIGHLVPWSVRHH